MRRSFTLFLFIFIAHYFVTAQIVNLTCVAGGSVNFTYNGPNGACSTTPSHGTLHMNFGSNCAAANQNVIELQSQCGCCPIFNNDCIRYTNTNYLAGSDMFVIRGITYNVTITATARLFCPAGGSVTFSYDGPNGSCATAGPLRGNLYMNFGSNCAATTQDVMVLQSQCGCCPIFRNDCLRYTNTSNSNTSERIVIRDNTYVIYVGNVLPVTITDFKAHQQNTSVNVEWTTEEESNMSSYIVERSENSQQFTPIGTVTPYNNNSGLTSSYTFIDQHPLYNINYYRLKMTELTGAVKYSNIVKVEMGKGTPELVVAPNPIQSNRIQLQLYNLPKGKYRVTLINNTGQQLMNKEISHEGSSVKQTINLDNNITTGIYQLRISGNNTILIKTVVK